MPAFIRVGCSACICRPATTDDPAVLGSWPHGRSVNADRHGRPRPHGGQHRAPSDAPRPCLGSLRPRSRARTPADGGRRYGGGEHFWIGGRPHATAHRLDHAAGRRGDRGGDHRAERPARSRRHHHRRRQHLLEGRHPPCARAWQQGPRVSRCRHLGRRVGARARLLPDDRRRKGRRGAARPDLRGAGAGEGRYPCRRRAARAAIRAPSGAICMPAPMAPGISSR